ncbi:DUF362 domain-containing protein [Streptomyces sp. TR1341]|uniref:DUF362 domain-containing protein n=1 Tax=Streptomyces sp. TR1341 TaxID=2601266 RepID=UPI00138AD435|nr:DUF362 domain-containing protein [Streptomyces sp. TR1341]
MSPTRSTVSLLRVEDRSDAGVRRSLEELLRLAGSPLDRLRTGDRVMVKPNMFQLKPGFHSSIQLVEALARAVADRGARVTVAERTRNLHNVLKDSRIAEAAEVVSFDDMPLRVVQIPEAVSLRVPLAVPEPMLDCDYFIGVPQLRTHSSVILTCALKNLVGLLPGYTTRIVHMAGVEESITDLNLMRHQDLVVCDALTTVQGNYPMAGEVVDTGLLAASADAFALDTVMAGVAGVDPDELGYLCHARSRGLAPAGADQVHVTGADPADVAFTIRRAPAAIRADRPRLHVHAETACGPCRQFIAAALHELAADLDAYPGELTVVSGPRERLPPLRGAVVLVGNALYDHREAGVYLEGCPPRAIQLAGFRHALGLPVSPEQRSQFRVPLGQYGPARPAPQPPAEEMV